MAKVKDPQIDMDAGELIKHQGYPFEEHLVTTDDGFILGLHRIPGGKDGAQVQSRGAVFIQHGLLQDSTAWLTNSPENTLPYILADNGYDVWLGNVRGNKYSQQHKNLKRESSDFWKWTWAEMAQYDLPTMVHYALKTSGHDNLAYVGHSQGTCIAFAGLPALHDKISVFFALAPVAYLKNLKSPLGEIARSDMYKVLRDALSLLGPGDFFSGPASFALGKIMAHISLKSELTKRVTKNVFFALAGVDTTRLEESRIPLHLSHSPSGTSLMNMVHYCQAVNTGKFQKYDHEKDNKKVYAGSEAPPAYDVSKIQTPMVAFSGGKDTLAAPDDVIRTVSEYGGLKQHVVIDEYDHCEFLWGADVAERVHKHILTRIQEG